MAALKPDTSMGEYQRFIQEVYGDLNVRHFDSLDLLTNTQRFLMRGMKGIRKNDTEKIVENLIISMGWFLSLMNRLNISLEEVIWQRFPYLCSYCGYAPCVCKAKKVLSRQSVVVDDTRKPTTLAAFQLMFQDIYPREKRTLEHAGIHLAEELGEVSEAFLFFRGTHDEQAYTNFTRESADLMSCYFGVFNSLDTSLSERVASYYSNNCHKCHQGPCQCTYAEMFRQT